MWQKLTAFLCLLFSIGTKAQFHGLIVNEFSQGDFGNREYIELLVAGHRTCRDSTADLRGWIFDDQNGWYGTNNSAAGHYRFKDDPNWANVPFGSIILVYNSASGEKNLSITLPDDPTDSNKDYTYIVPINSSSYFEQHNTEPNNFSGALYSYPDAGSNAGYLPSTNQWAFQISMNNNGDVISTVSPSKRDHAFFSIAYGYAILPGFQQPTVSIADVPAGYSAYLSNETYSFSSGWDISAVASNETPGLPNGGANSRWILSMREPAKVYFKTEMMEGCEAISYKGIFYTSSAEIRDTIRSLVTGCDSIITTIKIVIHPKPQLILPPDTIICKGSLITLNAFSDATVQWSGFGPGNSISLSPLSTAVYSAVATSSNGCMYTAYTKLTVEDFKLAVFASPNPAIVNNMIILQTSASLSYRVTAWRPASLFPGQSARFQQLLADTTTTITVVAQSESGCIDSASVTIAVDRLNDSLFIPTAFTPNGDGRNDLFRVLGGRFQKFDLRIYDRWGGLIFSAHDPVNGWDGNFGGKPGLTGVYVYTLKAILQNGRMVDKRGSVLLIR